MSIRVEAYAGYRNDERPQRFCLRNRWLEVSEVIDQWLSPERRYFKVRADDGCIYILRHDEHSGWELHFYDSGKYTDIQLSST